MSHLTQRCHHALVVIARNERSPCVGTAGHHRRNGHMAARRGEARPVRLILLGVKQSRWVGARPVVEPKKGRRSAPPSPGVPTPTLGALSDCPRQPPARRPGMERWTLLFRQLRATAPSLMSSSFLPRPMSMAEIIETSAAKTTYPHTYHGCPPFIWTSQAAIIGVMPEAKMPENW